MLSDTGSIPVISTKFYGKLRTGADQSTSTVSGFSGAVFYNFTANAERINCMSVFDRMLESENIEAFLESVERGRKMHSDELENCKVYLRSEEFRENVMSLKSGDYYFNAPQKRFMRKQYKTKLRTLYLFEEKDRFLMRYMCVFLHQYDNRFSDSLISFCKNKNIIKEVHVINRAYDYSSDYVTHLDVSSYGMSIDPAKLVSSLEKIVDDAELMNFFRWILMRREAIIDDELCEDNHGSLPGTGIHSFFLNVYLAETDFKYEKLTKEYARYADDVFMLFDDEETAESVTTEFIDDLNDLGLSVNFEKTGIVPPGESFSFLGYLFTGDGNLDIAPSTLKKMKRKIKIKGRRYKRLAERGVFTREEALEKYYHTVNRIFYGGENDSENSISYSERYFPTITTSTSLNALDKYVQQYARYICFGGFARTNYRMDYGRLKSYGHRSLVRAYYDYRQNGVKTWERKQKTKEGHC